MNIIYTEEPHQYIVDGEIYPALSDMMKGMGLCSYGGVPEHVLQKAADLGKAVHKATHLIDIDELGSYDPKIQPYINAYQSFKDALKPTFIDCEVSVASKAIKIATTLDRVALINGVVSDVEIKTTSALMKKSIRIQTAGHKFIYNLGKGHKDKIKKRYVLWLRNTGKYELIPMTNPNDEALFLSLTNAFNFIKEK